MEPDREGRSAASAGLRDAGLSHAGFRDGGLSDAWRLRSLATGWLTAGDWHSAAVDAVLAAALGQSSHGERPSPGNAVLAAVEDESLTAACAGLGRSRAKAGVGIAETIDDLAALFAVLGDPAGPAGQAGPAGRAGGPPLRLVCAIAEGWAEENLAQLAAGGCEDPLSGLATLPYLRTRLAELYQEAEQGGTSPADTHRLLVVRLPGRPNPWHRMALVIGVGHDLRAAFPGGETLSMAGRAGPGPAIALVPARRDLPLRYARLRRSVQATFGTQIRMTPLPRLLTEALRLVDELAC